MCRKYKKCIFPCKSEDEFRILNEECLTFETVTSCLAQRLRSFLHTFVRPDHVHESKVLSVSGVVFKPSSDQTMFMTAKGLIVSGVFFMPRVFLSLFEYFKGALQTAVYDVFQYFCFRPCYFFYRVCE